jgi:hypothetical protein
MHSANVEVAVGAHTPPAPHVLGAPEGAHARAFIIHVAGVTVGVCSDAAQLPPIATEADTLK